MSTRSKEHTAHCLETRVREGDKNEERRYKKRLTAINKVERGAIKRKEKKKATGIGTEAVRKETRGEDRQWTK